MRPHRVSIAGLLAVILIAALGLAALKMANALWASTVYSLAIFATLVAVLGAIFSREGLQAFCAGFAIFCGAYLVLIIGPWSDWTDTSRVWADSSLVVPNAGRPSSQAPVLTTKLLDWLHAMQIRPASVAVGSSVEVLWGGSYWPSTVIEIKDGQYKIHYNNHAASFDEWIGTSRLGRVGYERGYFLQVGHALCALVLGMIGGAIANLFRASRHQHASTT